jgi:hypothetical protein
MTERNTDMMNAKKQGAVKVYALEGAVTYLLSATKGITDNRAAIDATHDQHGLWWFAFELLVASMGFYPHERNSATWAHSNMLLPDYSNERR